VLQIWTLVLFLADAVELTLSCTEVYHLILAIFRGVAKDFGPENDFFLSGLVLIEIEHQLLNIFSFSFFLLHISLGFLSELFPSLNLAIYVYYVTIKSGSNIFGWYLFLLL